MATIHAAEEATVGAPAEHVYAILAGYRTHHPRILPAAFSDLQVEQGGIGAGTVISYRVKLLGQTRTARARVAEPEPGRVLSETDLDNGLLTTFTVQPAGDSSRVRIETRYEARGFGGVVAGLILPRLLRRMYVDELRRLDRYARQLAAAPSETR